MIIESKFFMTWVDSSDYLRTVCSNGLTLCGWAVTGQVAQRFRIRSFIDFDDLNLTAFERH